MSVINQVLNELEKRGKNAPLGEATIRAIPPRRPPPLLRYALIATATLALLAAAMWYLGRERMIVAEPVISSGTSGYGLMPGLSGAAAQTASMQPAAPAAAAEQIAAMAGIDAPASKLSFELSSIPLPDSLRSRPASEADAEPEVAEPVRKVPVQRERQQVRNKAAPKPGASPAANFDNTSLKQISPRQHAENGFRKANQDAQQGKADEAIAGYEGVLQLDPLYHEARMALVGVLLGAKRNADAERVLQDGLKRDSRQSTFAMLLARLQVERDALALALETLQKNLPHAERQPEYQAFFAALLQRQDRHKEAITHFQLALQFVPNNGVWLMGLGISLQAVQRNEDARDAYQRALGSNSLNPQLQEFVQNKLKEL
jgi:MSHA biogenesis protein MshN